MIVVANEKNELITTRTVQLGGKCVWIIESEIRPLGKIASLCHLWIKCKID